MAIAVVNIYSICLWWTKTVVKTTIITKMKNGSHVFMNAPQLEKTNKHQCQLFFLILTWTSGLSVLPHFLGGKNHCPLPRNMNAITIQNYKDIFNAVIVFKVLPDIFAIDQKPETQVHHVPWGRSVILHQVKGHGHMGMTVITTKIVL